jgi:hypothetical protein
LISLYSLIPFFARSIAVVAALKAAAMVIGSIFTSLAVQS